MTIDTIDPLVLPHIRGLLAAVDAGDDAVLPILADALEEQGDAKAAGLKDAYICGFRPLTQRLPQSWCWCCSTAHLTGPAHMLPPDVYRRLAVPHPVYPDSWNDPYYPTRSAAFLALAAALTE